MIEKIRQVFDDELQIEDIRKIATYEFEIDTFGYNYYYCDWKLPMGTFNLMFTYGFNNIRIMDSRKVDGDHLLTIRFTINEETLDEKLKEDKEWNTLSQRN